jgi:hypothetical protein
MTMAITTTLNRIRAHSPCLEGWKKLLSGLGKTSADDEPLAYYKIAEINGLDDALWCCRAEPQHWKVWRLYAVWCARQVQHLMTDPRSVAALDVAERHANGNATDAELDAARDAARDAALDAARDAARAAAWAAAWDAARAAARDAVLDAVWDAARAAAWAAARAAARDAERAAARDAALDAVWDAARAAAWAAQKSKFIEMVESAQ